MKTSMFVAVLFFFSAFANAQTCETRSAEVDVTGAYASDGLTFCGIEWTVQSVAKDSNSCAIAPNELIGQKFFTKSGRLVNGHDCEVDVPTSIVTGTVTQTSSRTLFSPNGEQPILNTDD